MIPILLLYLLFPGATTRVLAQAATEAGPWLTLANLGLAGLAIYAFTTGKIHSDRELQRVIARCDEEFKRIAGKLDAAEAELRNANKEAREVLVPTLTKATLLLSQFVDRQSDTPPPKGRG